MSQLTIKLSDKADALIAQLQNQDPTEPVDNAEILNQLATMQGLTSNLELSDTLKQVATSLEKSETDFGQKLSVGASYIGQTVTLDTAGNDFTGAVSVQGAAVTLVDTDDIELGASTITGAYSAFLLSTSRLTAYLLSGVRAAGRGFSSLAGRNTR